MHRRTLLIMAAAGVLVAPVAQADEALLKKHNCVACHQANGMGLPGNFPPLAGSKVVTGPTEEQIKLVLNGRKGVFTPTSMMPPQAGLSDVEIAAVITFTRNNWANKTGDMVTPSDVKASRK